MNETHPVASVSASCSRMRERCKLIDFLNGGTLALRADPEPWIPQEEGESAKSYEARVSRSILYGAYVDTRETILSRPFSKPITLEPQPADLLEGIEEDADMQGSSLTEWARDALRKAIDCGMAHGLVEYPTAQADNLEQVRALDIRPYFVLIPATSVIGTTWAKAPNGIERMTSIRWEECVEVSDEWGTKEELRIQRRTFVYEDQMPTDAGAPRPTGMAEVWVKNENVEGQWALQSQVPHSFVGLPIATLALREVRRMESRPVMEDLAWLNLAHCQSDSAQRNGLHYGRVAILFASGFTKDELGSDKFKLGPNVVVKTTNENAKLQYVETAGGALGAGRDDLRDLEARMEVQGLDPLMERRVNDQTATGAGIDASDESSDIQTWLRLEESFLESLYRMAGQYVGQELPADFSVSIFSEFSIPFADSTGIQNLLQMWQAGAITHRTLLEEIRRRSFVDASLDVDAEIAAVEAEGPATSDLDDDGEDDPPDQPEGQPPGTPPGNVAA